MATDLNESVFDERARTVLLRLHGKDRPGLIANATGKLEDYGLYIVAITFNLSPLTYDEYEMDILASGDVKNLNQLKLLIDSDDLVGSKSPPVSDMRRFHWPTACMFHLALRTPDKPMLTAKISDIVGKGRTVPDSSTCPSGSFVHLMGMTYNSEGPEGGTAYYSLRANIATESIGVQQQIMEHVSAWADKYGIADHVWMRDLNPQ